MGSGASKQKTKQLVTPTITVVNDGGVATAPKLTVPPSEDVEAIALRGEDRGNAGVESLNPSEYISPGQSIVRDGIIWKLNLDADPEASDQWMLRRMWLTDSGGLFYYSKQYGRPVGRSVASLVVRPSEHRYMDRYVFELQSVDHDFDATSPTLLATDAEMDRDAWVQALRVVLTEVEKAGSNGALDPLEPIAGRSSTDRRRLTRIPTTFSVVSLHKSTSTASYHGALRESLTSRLSAPITGRRDVSTNTVASLGPSAFGDGDRIGIGLASHKPSTCRRTNRRRDSQAEFASKRNTVLVLDWDDTLFPTTFIRTDCGLDWRTELRSQVAPGPGLDELEESLSTLSGKVSAFISSATLMAKVVVVTLAKRPWVETSAKNFMPKLATLLEEHCIEVVYARETLTTEMKKAYKRDGFRSSEQEADFWMRAKATAMLQQFHEHYEQMDASWKNVISIGDSNFERLAVITVAEDYIAQAKQGADIVELAGLTSELLSKTGHRMRLRTKALKMLDEPALEEMVAQVTLVNQWLPYIIQRDQGFDIAFEDSWDDRRLNELHHHITGSAACDTLTWRALAGLDPE